MSGQPWLEVLRLIVKCQWFICFLLVPIRLLILWWMTASSSLLSAKLSSAGSLHHKWGHGLGSLKPRGSGSSPQSMKWFTQVSRPCGEDLQSYASKLLASLWKALITLFSIGLRLAYHIFLLWTLEPHPILVTVCWWCIHIVCGESFNFFLLTFGFCGKCNLCLSLW